MSAVEVRIKIVIAEDMDILRESLKYTIESNHDIEVVGLASDGRQAYDLCVQCCPELVLMDIKMPGCDGIEGTRLIKNAFPAIKVLILTTFEDNQNISAAMSNGADGYITKDILPLQLQQTIKSVVMGLKVVNGHVMDMLMCKIESGLDEAQLACIKQLSVKEETLIRLVVEGKTYKEMGCTLSLSEGYVRNMVCEILSKLNLRDKIQLAVFAVKNKIV